MVCRPAVLELLMETWEGSVWTLRAWLITGGGLRMKKGFWAVSSTPLWVCLKNLDEALEVIISVLAPTVMITNVTVHLEKFGCYKNLVVL
jgi:hypothetical protein